MRVSSVFSDNNYAADYFRSDSSREIVVITFSEFSYGRLDGNGFATDFLLKNGLDVVAIKSRHDTWYSDLSQTSLARVGDFLAGLSGQHRRRITYGSSMGGYAAIMFAKELSADKAIAISPQFDISLPFDTRWARFASANFRVLSSEDVCTDCRYIFIYDPYHKDAEHVRLFHSIISPAQVMNLKVPHSGHPSGRTLADVRVLGKIIRAVIEDDQSTIININLTRFSRLSPRYFYFLARHLAKAKRWNAAYAAIERALEAEPYQAEYHSFAAAISVERRDNLEAIKHASAAAALANGANPHMPAFLAELLRDKGLKQQAIRQYEAVVSIRSNPIWERALADLKK